MAKNTVLIGFAEALAAPEAAWSLVDHGFRVIAFARRGKKSPLCHSKFVEIREITAPEADFEASLADLKNLLNSVQLDSPDNLSVLVPLDDTAVLLASKVQIDQQGWLLAGPKGSCAEVALNKCRQTIMATQAGMRVPKSWYIVERQDVSTLKQSATFPMIIKPAECVPVVGGQLRKGRQWICADSTELERALEEWDGVSPLLAQQFVPGVGEGVFGMATSSGVCAWSAHKRLRMMNPHGSGSSACVSHLVDPATQAQVEKLVALISWRGLFMIEFLRDSAGHLWFIEMNGRPWGSTALSRRQGLEYPAWQVELALGDESVGHTSSGESGVVCRHVSRELMHLLFVIRGPKSRALERWPSFWHSAVQVMRVHRGDRIYNWCRQDPMVFLADFYYTLIDNMLKPRRTA